VTLVVQPLTVVVQQLTLVVQPLALVVPPPRHATSRRETAVVARRITTTENTKNPFD
jgi:hypothetical protein